MLVYIVKLCRKCDTVKTLDCFGKHSGHSDGFQSVCKLCKSKTDKDYRDRNLEKSREKSRLYYQNNRERLIENTKKYALNNAEKVKKQHRDYYQKNKSAWVEYSKQRAEIDPIYKAKISLRKLILKSLSGQSKSKNTQQIIGCSFEEFVKHIESQFEPWMNWSNKGVYNGQLNAGWDIDHIIPLSSAKSVEQIYKLNHHSNLRPLCSYVNRNIKRNKI
jgi:hypothetical protein